MLQVANLFAPWCQMRLDQKLLWQGSFGALLLRLWPLHPKTAVGADPERGFHLRRLSRRIRLLGSLVLLLFVMLVARVGLRVASVLPASGLPLKRDTGGVPLVNQGFAVLLLGAGLCLVETLQLWAILVYC